MVRLSPLLRQMADLVRRRYWLSNITSAIRDDATKCLSISWSDGLKSRFPYAWLRDHCPESHTTSSTEFSRSNILKLKDLDVEITPQLVKPEDDGEGLHIDWPDVGPCFYPSQWLKDRDFGNPTVAKQGRGIHLMDKSKSWDEAEIQKALVYRDFERLFTDKRYLHDTLSDFCVWGFLLLDNVPIEQGQLARLRDLLGYSTSTHYGHHFHVRHKRDFSNLAYTTDALELHTDLPSCQSPPQIQCLHCIVNTEGEGEGVSLFADGFKAAEFVRATRRDYHDLLCSVPLEFHDHGVDNGPFFLAAQHHVIKYNMHGDLQSVIYNHFRKSWLWSADPETVVEMYRACKYLNEFMRADGNQLKLPLRPGQMVIFDNLRVLHGRTKYEATDTTERFLEGIYFPYDAFKSRLRYLRFELELPSKFISI